MSKSQKSKYEKWSKTQEADNLRQLEKSFGLRLDGIAFFLANNPPFKNNVVKQSESEEVG